MYSPFKRGFRVDITFHRHNKQTRICEVLNLKYSQNKYIECKFQTNEICKTR